MGTRHLICVVKDNEYKVAQYGQWDGYPEGQGVDILNFLNKELNKNIFINALNNITYLSDEEYASRWLEFGVDINDNNGLVDCQIYDKFCNKYPELDRDTGADILIMIQNSNGIIKLRNALNFAADSLFCEWAYVIDLDKNMFEVYEGFNQFPLDDSERFKRFEMFKTEAEKYYPVKHVISYDLNNLPSIEEFLNEFMCEDEED